jgi:hypothetical protein
MVWLLQMLEVFLQDLEHLIGFQIHKPNHVWIITDICIYTTDTPSEFFSEFLLSESYFQDII